MTAKHPRPLLQSLLPFSCRARLTFLLSAPRLAVQQPFHSLLVHCQEPATHRRDPQAVPATVQKSGGHAATGPGTTTAGIHEHLGDERGGAHPGDAADAGVRGGHFLHDVQPQSRGQIPCPGLHNRMPSSLYTPPQPVKLFVGL